MLSCPVFTMQRPQRVLVMDQNKLGTLNGICNLILRVRFRKLNHFERPEKYPFEGKGWTDMCQTLATMKKLQHLRISIVSERFNWWFAHQDQSRSEEQIRKLLWPLNSIGQSGSIKFFVVVAQGWKLPFPLHYDVPFKFEEYTQEESIKFSASDDSHTPWDAQMLQMSWSGMYKSNRKAKLSTIT